jgi:5'-nucleotidase
VRRVITGATVGALVIGAGALVAAPAQAADPVTINLVTVNDFHGRIEALAPSGGIAALATAVKGIRATNPNTVFAAAGDMIGASTFTSFIQNDIPTIDTLNAAGLEVSAAGNHEFDKGWADLKGRVQDRANWEYIAANVYEKSTGKPALAESWVKTMGGVRVGFIGAVTEELPSLVNPTGIADLEVRDIVDSVNAVADKMTDGVETASNGEADVLVLLVHEGAGDTKIETATDSNNAFGYIVNNVTPKVNAIVSGHTHLAYDHEVPYSGDTGIRPVISSGQYGEKFSNMVIQVDPDSKQVLSMNNTVYDMVTPPGSSTGTPLYTQDPSIATMVAAAVEAAKEPGSKVLGNITADFNKARQLSGADNRGGESTLGNFVADAQLWSAQRMDAATQIGFMNPGGLRENMAYAPDGKLTYREAADVQSFANTLVTLSMTGAQIRQALEQQWQPAGASRPFLKLGISKGFEYVFDPAAAPGSRITRMTLNGADIVPMQSYRVVANSFLAGGGDNFKAIGEGTNKRDTGKVDLESMVDYMAHLGTASPDYGQRSIGATLPGAGSLGYEAGTTFDLPLSSLDFSTTEPVVTTVSVSIGGKPAGSGSVTRSLPTTHADVSGVAKVAVTIPEGVTGGALGAAVTVPLTVMTAEGTEIDIPIQVFERADSTTVGVPNKTFANSKGNGVIQYLTTVTAEGGAEVTGDITIYDGDQPIKTVTLTAEDEGVVQLKLPKLAAGTHELSVAYSGSETVKPSTSTTVTVVVK